jgi:endonuclease YncB( thermonuclease family)
VMLGCECLFSALVGKVVSIADGDTLTALDASRVQRKIRLADIDAPERQTGFWSALPRASCLLGLWNDG